MHDDNKLWKRETDIENMPTSQKEMIADVWRRTYDIQQNMALMNTEIQLNKQNIERNKSDIHEHQVVISDNTNKINKVNISMWKLIALLAASGVLGGVTGQLFSGI